MSKKLLSTLIASLFATAPAFAQSDDDPMRVQGTATLGGLYNNTSARDTAKLYRVPGPRQRRAVERRRPGPQQQDVVLGLRRELRPHRPVHVPARRHVRRVQGGCLPQRHPARALVERLDALRGRRRHRPDGDLPARRPSGQSADRVEQLHAGLRPARRRRLCRVAEEQPLVLPRRRQPGQVQRNQGRIGVQRHEPGQRLYRPCDPERHQDQQLGRRGRLSDDEGDVCDPLGLQQVRERQLDAAVDEPVLRQEPARLDLPRAGQHVQQVHGVGQLPRPAVAERDLGALHVGEDDERLPAGAVRAQHSVHGRLQRARCPTRTTSTARTSTSRSSSPGPRARPPTSTRASTTTGPSSRTTPTWSSTGTPRRPRLRPASAAATS